MMLFYALEPNSDASCGGCHGNDAHETLHWLTLLLANLRSQVSALRKSGKVSGTWASQERPTPLTVLDITPHVTSIRLQGLDD